MVERDEILVAIAELKRDTKHLEDYIYDELKPDIQKLCDRVEACTVNAAECYTKNLKWIVTTAIALIIGATSLVAVIMMAV